MDLLTPRAPPRRLASADVAGRRAESARREQRLQPLYLGAEGQRAERVAAAMWEPDVQGALS